ncbi:RICIN domain-containing protein [Burkholderia plantarii]|nr:RICIN domain-containing protein [Burkholderia plantarii]
MPQDVKKSATTVEEDQQDALAEYAKLGLNAEPVPGDSGDGAKHADDDAKRLRADGKEVEHDRLEQLTDQDFTSKLEQREREMKQQRKEAADHRSQLLSAVRVAAPEISKPLVETFEKLSNAGHKFADKELVRLMKSDAQLQDSRDFFDLNLAEREDLLDRVGFYKGIVIDHSLSNPVESGFREVLKRQDGAEDESGGGHCQAAKLLYRKPNFAGYFENYFSTSESLHQLQQNGVTDIKASVGVAVGGVGAKVGVGVSGSYFQSEQESSGNIGKKIYTTANYFLPKIELSFDNLRPCASDDFLAACEDALGRPYLDQRFAALLAVLGSFGHFVSTQTLVGGRLFATETKTFTGKESDTNVTTRFAAKVKASVSTYAVDVEAEVSGQHGRQTQARANETDEQQQFTVQAVGGEGAVAEQAGRWAESLYDYRRWAAVQREKLIPSIDVLPASLRELAWNTLTSYARLHSAMHLIEEYSASFLFYGYYNRRVGSLAQADLVGLRNLDVSGFLAVKPDYHLGRVELQTEPAGIRKLGENLRCVWRLSPEGHIVSMIETPGGIAGRKSSAPFVLSAEETTKSIVGTDTTCRPVALKMLGTAKNQNWVVTDHGEIYNQAFGPNQLLQLQLGELVLVARGAAKVKDASRWQVTPIVASDHPKLAGRAAMGKIRHVASGLVLSIEGAEAKVAFGRSEQRGIVMQPDIGGRHQLWRLNDASEIVSVLSAVEGVDASTRWDVYLTADNTNKLVAQPPNLLSQAMKWHGGDKRLTTNGSDGKIMDAVAHHAARTVAGGAVTQYEGVRNDWIYEPLASDVPVVGYRMATPRSERTERGVVRWIDGRELVVDGYLTGIGLTLIESERGRQALSLRAHVERRGRVEDVDLACGGASERDEARFISFEQTIVDERLLILPAEQIFSIRLNVNWQPVCRLAFEYRLTVEGEWHTLSPDHGDRTVALSSDGFEVVVDMARDEESMTRLSAIGLEYSGGLQVLKPKVLLRTPG